MKYVNVSLDVEGIEQEGLEQLEVREFVRRKAIGWRISRIVGNARAIAGHLKSLENANIKFKETSNEGKRLIAVRSLIEKEVLPRLIKIIDVPGVSVEEFKRLLPQMSARELLSWIERMTKAPNIPEIVRQITEKETSIMERKVMEGIQKNEITMDEMMRIAKIGIERGLVFSPPATDGISALDRRRNIFRILFRRKA